MGQDYAEELLYLGEMCSIDTSSFRSFRCSDDFIPNLSDT